MSSSHEAGYRGLIDLPAARLADIRQPRDRLRLLICESESAARQSLVEGLLGLNVEVACSDDGARALLDVGRLSPDVLLIAADLPPLGAPAVIKTVREISDRHIIVGAGPGQSDLVAAAIEAGADRLMERPYSIDQLRAVMLDFRSSVELDAVPLQVGPLKVDPLAYEVFLGDQIIPVPVRELEVLLYLIYHRDRVVTVRELQDALWASGTLSPNSNSAAVAINRLRSRFAEHDVDIIRTVRRRGYRFHPPQLASHASAQPSTRRRTR
jgi:two-component system response regulator RegX3